MREQVALTPESSKKKSRSKRARQVIGRGAAVVAGVALPLGACAPSPAERVADLSSSDVYQTYKNPQYSSVEDMRDHPMGVEWSQYRYMASFANSVTALAGDRTSNPDLAAFIEANELGGVSEGYVPLTTRPDEAGERGYVRFRFATSQELVLSEISDIEADGAVPDNERTTDFQYVDNKAGVDTFIRVTTSFRDELHDGELPRIEQRIGIKLKTNQKDAFKWLSMQFDQQQYNDRAAVAHGEAVAVENMHAQIISNNGEIYTDKGSIVIAVQDIAPILDDIHDALKNKPVNSLVQLDHSE